MKGCTEDDRRLKDLPYAKYIPHVMMNNGNRLQCRDMIERNFWWGLFVGMFMGCYMTSRLRYGDMLSP